MCFYMMWLGFCTLRGVAFLLPRMLGSVTLKVVQISISNPANLCVNGIQQLWCPTIQRMFAFNFQTYILPSVEARFKPLLELKPLNLLFPTSKVIYIE